MRPSVEDEPKSSVGSLELHTESDINIQTLKDVLLCFSAKAGLQQSLSTSGVM